MVASAEPSVLIYHGGDAAPPADCGGKARGLAAIAAAGLTTAPWFVAPPGTVQRLLDQGPGAEVAAAVDTACRALAPGQTERFAVRSSAPDEDGARVSSAGQYTTILDVPGGESVIDAMVSCAGTRGPGSYRAALGMPESTGSIAVIVQAMVPAVTSGIAFSRSPDGADRVVVAATRGLGAQLAGGQEDGEEYQVRGDGTVEMTRGGTPGERCLDDEQIRAVAAAAVRLEVHRGCPQDVEWAFAPDGTLVVLQTRPITARAHADSGTVRVWDNANIVESFPGLTTPLTFSVAREAYAEVYRQACRAMGVSVGTIAANGGVFEEMLGLLRGRVYYNLSSWHRVLGLLPGLRYNQAFLERMMGARRPDDPARPREGSASRIRESITIVATLTWRYLTLERQIRDFLQAIDALRAESQNRRFEAMSAEALLTAYEQVQERALRSWQAPILNDLFLMGFHGATWKAAERWLHLEPSAVGELLRVGDVSSLEPLKALAAMAKAVRQRPEACEALLRIPDAELVTVVQRQPALAGLQADLDGYLERWGARCPEELQLDRATYRSDPAPLLRAIRDLVQSTSPSFPDAARHPRGDAIARFLPHPIENDGKDRLTPVAGAQSWLRRRGFGLLVQRTRRHIARREAMRFARGEVFAIARRIFSALGSDLAASGALDRAEDVHYLDVDELRRFVRGTGCVQDLRTLVAARRAAYGRYRHEPTPAGRVTTRGPVATARLVPDLPPAASCAAGVLRGSGAAPGRVRAPVVVVDDPRLAPAVQGRIVAARSTDPGWIPIFAIAAGLLVQHGSILSHSAIVARELGIPTVVGIPGLLDTVSSGQMVELDGASGEVLIWPPSATPEGERGG
jgi:pyruvate,water dikinase